MNSYEHDPDATLITNDSTGDDINANRLYSYELMKERLNLGVKPIYNPLPLNTSVRVRGSEFGYKWQLSARGVRDDDDISDGSSSNYSNSDSPSYSLSLQSSHSFSANFDEKGDETVEDNVDECLSTDIDRKGDDLEDISPLKVYDLNKMDDISYHRQQHKYYYGLRPHEAGATALILTLDLGHHLGRKCMDVGNWMVESLNTSIPRGTHGHFAS